jgi:hypothetical protein
MMIMPPMLPPNVNVNVSLSQINGEKLMDLEKGMVNLQVTTNISITRAVPFEGGIDFGFVFAVNYNPAVANLTLKGSIKVVGGQKEIGDLRNAFEEKKTLPPGMLQAISNAAFVECILLARSLNVPPPIPLPIIQSQEQKPKPGPNPSYIA